MANCRSVQQAIENYKAIHGQYPKSLDAANAAVGPDWNYRPTNGGKGYVLWTTTNHWVSSFDVLLYDSSQHYESWTQDEYYTMQVEDWVYVVGQPARLAEFM